MPFQNKSPWLLKDIGALTDGEMGNKGPWVLKEVGALINGEMSSGTSMRREQKRAHQLFMDASEGELFSNKKQAVQSVGDTPISTPASSNFSYWSNTSNCQSAPVPSSDRSSAPESLGTFSFGTKDLFSLGNENVTTERSRFINLLQNNSTVGLSMSHAGEDPLYLNAGTRGARVNLADECTRDYPFLLRNSSNTGEDGINATSLGLAYRAGTGNVISMGHDFAKEKPTPSLIDSTNYMVNANCMPMGHQYSKGDRNLYLMDQSLDTGNGYYKTVNQLYKEEGNFMLIPSYKKAQENFISMFPSYRKADEDFMSVGMTGNKDIGVASRIPTPDNAGTCSKENSSFISMNKFERGNISFGGFQHETGGNNTSNAGKLISIYDLMISEPSVDASESLTDKNTVEHSADQIETVAPKSTVRTENVSPQKVQKTPKSSRNNFPSNVKSLMATGILDGVPVKYVSWSREKTVRGVIKGTGYLCGCNDCKLSKSQNAFDFESHAACKTRHPNGHIYFENGKSIYAVVQELKSTPQEKLFEVIQNITGSPINQKNFETWKEAFQAARCELQHIYAKSEVAKPS
ncbi:hypothetical protein K7X08_031167 [Anisodus acutangulus]|uniref:Tify domain-containing protein n=1 Tax=Anisodus acutangulus TaxID=402998 RepID=A0A9Q1RLY0_9SOLA|nr:hypothetical protein K7X08_031167 [Anisodus acutangulus]